jgi:hypothetical protein
LLSVGFISPLASSSGGCTCGGYLCDLDESPTLSFGSPPELGYGLDCPTEGSACYLPESINSCDKLLGRESM